MNEEILNEIEETIEKEIEVIERKNPFCVISIVTYGEYEIHDIQTNSSWSSNPYETGYAVVPDEMIESIVETRGFCDIVLNEDETEIVSFTAREIPVIPESESEPTQLDRIEAQVTYTAMMTDTLMEA